MIKITIKPGQKELIITSGVLLLDILKQIDIMISTPCGGKGSCGKCKIILYPQDSALNANEKKWLTEEEIKKGFRLACQCYIHQDSTITVPEYSVLKKEDSSNNGKIKTHFLDNDFKPSQQIKKVYLQLDTPTLQDQRSDYTRIKDALNIQLENNYIEWKVPIDILEVIPQLLRNNSFNITLALCKDTIIAAEAGDTREQLYGIAFDVGTTTIAGYLIDLTTFQEIGIEACANPQSMYGDDIISRIDFTKKDPKGKQKLQHDLISTLNQIIFSLSHKAEIDVQNIYFTVLVGNTCMHHFLWSLPTKNIATSPYVPVITEKILKESHDLPYFCLSPHTLVYTVPNVSAFIGGDIIADMIDISIWRKTGNTLMVDLGTNGEIILTAGGKIWACSAAAGPAFEGARVSSGMRAAAGAIDRVRITNQKLDYNVIGQSKATGICGSGLVDLVAELLKLKIIEPNGRLVKQEECPNTIAYTIKERILQGEKYNQFLIVPSQKSSSGEPIYLTQKDVREMQLAKGAVAAGIRILLDQAQVEINSIEEILLAGAFGNVIDTASALDIGIIPDISLDRIRCIGNAAGQGAEKLLLSENMRYMADWLSKKVNYIELSSHRDFQNIFADSLLFRNPE